MSMRACMRHPLLCSKTCTIIAHARYPSGTSSTCHVSLVRSYSHTPSPTCACRYSTMPSALVALAQRTISDDACYVHYVQSCSHTTCHVRAQVCRRAERSVVALARSTTSDDANPEKANGEEQALDPGPGNGGIPPNSVVDVAVVVYINRLSDYLFTAARYLVGVIGLPTFSCSSFGTPCHQTYCVHYRWS